MAQPNYNAFHGEESFVDGLPPVTKWQSFRNLTAALWKHRAALRAAPVAAAKDIIPELPINDPVSKFMSNEVMHMLWGSMLHPPSSYKGPEFQYRSADGSNNSMLYPQLGKAGLPYAKSVQAQKAVHGAKPDPGDLFDLLMARPDEGKESTTGISSLLLYQATIVIHDIFRSNDDDKNISDTSSYLDLSPLYGKDAEDLKTVRKFEDGLMKPDTFAEHRLLNQPPGVSIFLIMYNRFHNYVAKQLKEINENGKFDLPPNFHVRSTTNKQRAEALEKQDEDLFQTARLITCGLYAQIAVHDYLRCLMVMHEKDTAWTLDPRREVNRFLDRGAVARGQGNMVSVEFNLLYRFHSALSRRDTDWSAELMKMWLVDRKPTAEQIAKGEVITAEQVENGDVPASVMMKKIKAVNTEAAKLQNQKMEAKCFPPGFDRVGGNPVGNFVFTRNADGYFDDAQMVAELVRCMEDPMCSFGALQIPKVFKSIEMLGILQSRKWEVASLNEFREFFGMSRHKTFEDINSDPKIQNALRDLYGNPDSVELYPGYLCEGQGRNLDPNVSCPNKQATALWRGVFSDAVTLVRSDRFYTTEWNVDAITGWGMREVTSDPTINKGGLWYKLAQRAFPGYFAYNSLHLWQPYYTPAKNLQLAEEQGYLKNLNLDGLEYQFEGDGKTWTPLNVTKNSEGEVTKGFFKRLAGSKKAELRVRRKCLPNPKLPKTIWRGGELATKVISSEVVISDYSIIKSAILGGPSTSLWKNPAIVAGYDIPAGSLRTIMTNKFDRWDNAMAIVGTTLGAKEGKLESQFRAYFVAVAEQIRLREQRPFQKVKGKTGKLDTQVYQMDVVKDYAIPVVTRFISDWLGFWDRVKGPGYERREFSENAIYELIDRCQDYQSWDADQTKGMKKRQQFQKAIVQLQDLASYGVTKSSAGLFWWRDLLRSYGPGSEAAAVINVRKLAVKSTRALLTKFTHDEVSSLMLAFALESAHKLVMNFTETLAYFIDPKTHKTGTIGCAHGAQVDMRTQHWAQLQQLALKDTAKADAEIAQYALEAQRLSPAMKLARQYTGSSTQTVQDQTVKSGTTILVDLQAANHDLKVFASPDEFRLRDTSKYLIYGSTVDAAGKTVAAPFAKQLALAYLTGLLKHTASMRELRVAHDKLGRLKRVNTPGDLPGYERQLPRYASACWDDLLPFPTTWEVRYNGMGEGIFEGGDNANQGHGQNQVYSYEEYSYSSHSESSGYSYNAQQEQVKEIVSKMSRSEVTKLSHMTTVSAREITNSHSETHEEWS